jgi:hypothetical protein
MLPPVALPPVPPLPPVEVPSEPPVPGAPPVPGLVASGGLPAPGLVVEAAAQATQTTLASNAWVTIPREGAMRPGAVVMATTFLCAELLGPGKSWH